MTPLEMSANKMLKCILQQLSGLTFASDIRLVARSSEILQQCLGVIQRMLGVNDPGVFSQHIPELPIQWLIALTFCPGA